jgi:hypothetical protein
MIRECQVLPINLPDKIKEGRDAAAVINTNPFLQAHRVEVREELMRARAKMLFPPAIQYNPRQECVEPNQQGGRPFNFEYILTIPHFSVMDWRMVGRDVNPNRQYFKPAEWPQRWAIIIVQNAVSTNACQYVLFF